MEELQIILEINYKPFSIYMHLFSVIIKKISSYAHGWHYFSKLQSNK